MGLFGANPEKRRKRKVARLKRRAGRGNVRAMGKLEQLKDYNKNKGGPQGVSDAELRQGQAQASEQIGAQLQGAMSGMAPAGPMGVQSGMQPAQMQALGEAAAEGGAQASAQSLDTLSRIKAQAYEAYKARITRANEYQMQKNAQTAGLVIQGGAAAISGGASIAGGVGGAMA